MGNITGGTKHAVYQHWLFPFAAITVHNTGGGRRRRTRELLLGWNWWQEAV